jgi:hypothetical protein
MVVTDHPAPPRNVEQSRAGSRVLEVEERADLPVCADDDIDRGEIAVDEAEPLQGVQDAWIPHTAVEQVVVEIDGSQLAREPAHPVREMTCPIGIVQPARSRLAVDPVREQPKSAGSLDDRR